MQLADLIDGASARAGSDYKLAQTLGVPRQVISDWRHNRRTCGVEYRALMADLAGYNVDEVIHEALLEKHANTPLGERLLSVLGNVGAGAVATMSVFGSVGLFDLVNRCMETTRCRLLRLGTRTAHC